MEVSEMIITALRAVTVLKFKQFSVMELILYYNQCDEK